MQEVELPPIKIGFEYSVAITFEADYLAPGEAVRAELRETVNDPVPLAEFEATRAGQTITLYLTAGQTAGFETTPFVLIEPTLVLIDATELPLNELRFVSEVTQHGTRST